MIDFVSNINTSKTWHCDKYILHHIFSKIIVTIPILFKQDKIEIDVDVRNYTKYLLKEGTLIEKRELLGCLQSKLFLKDKKVMLE